MPSDTPDQAQRALNAIRARARRKALGPPLDVDDLILDALALAGMADLPFVEAFIRDSPAGQRGVDLLRATRG